MILSARVTRDLETELQLVEDRLRAMSTELNSLLSSTSTAECDDGGDLHGHERTWQATETVHETRSRLLTRGAGLREALHRLQNGTYGRCGDCDRPISERRLLVLPEATRCVRCQEQRERRLGLE